MKSILDRSFQYTPSAETDLKKTFVRIRRRLEERAQAVADCRRQDHDADKPQPERHLDRDIIPRNAGM